jgi:hypothetical protein
MKFGEGQRRPPDLEQGVGVGPTVLISCVLWQKPVSAIKIGAHAAGVKMFRWVDEWDNL